MLQIFLGKLSIVGMVRTINLKHVWVLLLLVLTSLVGGSAMAQTTYTWIGGNGSWITTTNWSPTRSTPATTDILQFNDGGTYTLTALLNGQTVRQLVVTNNTNITLTSTAAATLNLNFPVAASNALVVASGSTLSLGSPTFATNLTFTTTTTQRGDISGELILVNSTFSPTVITTAPGVTVAGSLTNSNGTVTSSTASLTFSAGAYYNHARNGGALPTATWNAASTVNVTGITTTALTAIVTGQTFGNFTWNCPSQTLVASAVVTGAGTAVIAGNLNVDAGSLTLGSFSTSFAVTGATNIGSNGTLRMATATTGTRTFTGDVTIDGSWIEGVAAAMTFAGNFTNNGTFTSSTGVHTFSGTSKAIGGSAATTINSVTVNGTYTNNSTADFNVLTTFAGTGTITAASGSVLGFGGTSFAAPTLAITTNPNTFVYNGAANQTIRAITYYNLEINKPTGIVAHLGGNFSVNNNLSVLSGTLSDATTATAVTVSTLSITGNATGTFTIAADATYNTNHTTTGPWMPTAFVSLSISPLATINFGTSVTHNIPTLASLPISAWPIFGISSTGIKTLVEPITVYGLNLGGGTLVDGGYQITGNASGPVTIAASTGLTLGIAATATQFPTNFVNANMSLATTSTVIYNSNQATTISGEPTYGNLTLAATVTTVKTLAANTTVLTTTTIGLNNTLDVNGKTLELGGTLTNSGATAILTANATNSKIRLIGSSGQTINMGSGLTGGLVSTLEVDKTAGTATLSTTSFDVTDLNIINGILSNGSITIGIRGSYANTGTFTVNSGGAVAFNGTTAQTFDIGTYTSSLVASLIINNPAGVTLNAPVNVTTLTLTDGVLNTDATNILNVKGLTAANILTPSATAYVKGPMTRLLPNGASIVDFVFPVGKGIYNPFVLSAPTTSATTVVVQVEVVDAVAGGTAATGFSATPTPARYWVASATTSPANLLSAGAVRLQDSGMTISGNSAIGRSATLTGVYSGFGGTTPNSPSTGDLTTTIAIPGALGYFKIGEKGALCGTYTVGTGENFATLTEAVSVLNGANVTCNVVFELTNNFSGSGETFPIVFNELSYVGGPWTVTVRPSASVTTTRTIAGIPGSTLPLINLNGIDNLIFDGVPGGSTGGSVVADSRLLLRNTQTAATVAPTVLFNNDATNNTLKYLQIEGQNIVAPSTASFNNSGTIAFGSTATTTGNSNNTISYCAIGNRADAPTTYPSVGIYSLGASSSLSNDNNTISNNNIFNFYAATGNVGGVFASINNSAWTVSGNSFYQTGNRTPTSPNCYGIYLQGSSGTDHVVNGNYIGGSAPLAAGSKWSSIGTSTNSFVGIQVGGSSSSNHTITNNVISNITWTCVSSSANIWIGIYAGLNGGYTITGNRIGNDTGNDDIIISTGTTGASSYGILHTTTNGGGITISNNKVGAVTAKGTTTALSHNFYGIQYTQSGSGTSRLVSGNLIGSLTTANSIQTGPSSSTTLQMLVGIEMSGGANAIELSNNTVANLTNTYTSTGASLTIGIRGTGGLHTVTGNTVFGISSNAVTAGVGALSAVSGIVMNASALSGHTLSGNTVHTISSTSASGNVSVNGIYFNPANSTVSPNYVTGNLVHSVWTTNSATTAVVYGIQLGGGTNTTNHVNNNMIRLGIKADGTAHNVGNLVYGLYELSGTNNVLHNSIYIGGSGTLNGNSYAYYTVPTNTTRNIYNNIFVNARSSTSGTGKHYAIRVGGSTNLNSNYNDLYATGTNGYVGLNNTTDYATLTDWQLGGEGANSISGNPGFINATGNAASVNLHIVPAPTATPIEAVGTGSFTTATDIDGQTRSAFTPVDLGADAGNFEGIDLTLPAITFTDLAGACNSASTHTLSGVAITDASGINVTTGTAPRIYYKKSTDANTSTGWKYVESTTGSSPFTFNINFALLTAGSVSAGDVIQYFVVAQDAAPVPNVGVTSGTFNAQPSSVALGSGAFPIGGTVKEFGILPCSGTVTVGTTGANYPSLTNPGGLFEAINAATLSGNLVANITTDLTLETGTHPLNQWAESGVGTYTVTIQADGTTQRLIASTTAATTGLIRIIGADRATFNGGTGTNRYLLFRNTITNGATASTFSFSGDATNNTINNCVIEGATTTAANGVISFGTGVSTGNSNNTITNNDIKDNGTLPVNTIYSVGTTTTAINNSGNTVSNNNISNFFGVATASAGIYLGAGNNTWTIQNNKFFQTATRTTTSGVTHSVIYINNSTASQGGHTITGNYIGGSNAAGTGTMNYTSASTALFAAINLVGVSSTPATTISNNTITNLSFTSTSGTPSTQGVFSGIYVGTSASNLANAMVISGNIIGAATGNGAISVTTTNTGAYVNGIKIDGTGTFSVSNNTIGSITGTGTGTNNGVYVYGINFTAGNVTADGNLIGSSSTTNSIQSVNTATSNINIVAGIMGTASASYSPNIINNQLYNLTNANTGTGAQIGGILTSGGGQYTITGNTVRNLTTNSTSVGTTSSASVVGISMNTANNTALTIGTNTVHSLYNSGAMASSVIGIYFSGGTSTSNAVSRNLVHSLSPANSTLSTASVTGIQLAGGTVAASNNMVRLGIDAAGSSIGTAQAINGILVSSTAITNVYFNTVYVGGTGVGSTTTSPTATFRRTATSGTHNFRNNIFVNARSNASTGSKHYAYVVANNTGVTSDYNLFHAPGTGGVLFSVNGGTTDLTTLAALQAAGGQNTNSGADNPNLVNPTGTASTVNLHITGITAAEGSGIAIAGFDVDFDGDDRTTLTPTDMGADATNATPKDITAPSVTVSTVPTQAPCGGTLSIDITATVTDALTGVNTTTFKPTLWWRLSTGSWASLAATSNTGNDWLYTLNLTGVVAGQTYQYYVVAQDLAPTPNIGYSNSDATSPVHANTTATPSTTNNNPASFAVSSASPLSGTVTVGTGGTYTTLSGVGGLFAAINANGLNGDLLVQVTTNTAETGNTSLYQWAEYCGTGYKVKVVPSSASVKTLSGSLIGFGLINIYASRVTFDGSFSGSGRYLKFENTYASSGGSENNTFKFDRYSAGSLATNDTIRNCEIVGNSTKTAGGVIYLSSGCSNILIDNNMIHGGTSWAVNIILATGATYLNENITITNNEIYNFLAWSGGVSTRAYGINVTNSANGSNWNISGNSIYNTGINGQGVQTAMRFIPGASSTGNTIAGNWIGGSSAQCGTGGGVTYWGNSYNPSNTEMQIKGMDISCGAVDIDTNNITNIWVSGGDYTGFIGMHITGATVANITRNVFGTGSAGTPDGSKLIQVSGGGASGGFNPGYIYGIWNVSTTTSMTTYDHNEFYYLFQAGSLTGGNVHVIFHQAAGPATITKNLINGPQGSGRGWNQFAIRFEPTASTSGNLIEGNIIAGPYINSLVNGGGTTNYGISAKSISSYTQSGTIAKNVVWDMRNADRSGYTEGIIVWSNTGGNGNWDIKNNQVSLMNNNSTGNCVGLYGIEVDLNSSSTVNVDYNTVFIGGSNGGSAVSGVDFSSYGLFRYPNGTGAGTGEVINISNNIFINWRLVSNGFVSGHCAIANFGSTTNWNASDYNFLSVANGAASFIGYWNGATRTTLANWQSATSKDANSKTATYTAGSSNFGTGVLNPANLFNNQLSDLHISISDGESYKFVDAQANPNSITTDYDGDTRDGTTPDIGADEFTACATPVVTAHPTSPTICAGANTSVSVTATGSGITYSWEVNTGSSWAAVTNTGVYTNSGTATLNIAAAPSSMNGYQYRATATNVCGNATSNAATLTVNAAPDVTTYNPPTFVNSICAGSNTSFGVTATGGGLTYTWQISTNSGSSWSNVANNATYSGAALATLSIANTPANFDGNLYRVLVVGTCTPADTSTVGTLNVTGVTFSVQPTSPSVLCEGGTVTISATANTSTYQWQVSTNSGGSWSDLSNGSPYSNVTTSDLGISPVSAAMSGYQYRVIATNTLCSISVNSNAATLTVNATPTAVTVSGGGTYCGSTIITATGGTGGTMYWQNTTSGGTSTATPSSSENVTSSGTYYFNARSSAGCWATEGSATITITAIATSTTWTGDVDADWFKWQNWTNCVPGAISDVTIPTGRPNYPAVYGSNPVANSVTIASGGSMTLNGGRTLVNTTYINNQGTLTMSAASIIQLGTNWTNTGTFNSGNGTVEFTGSSTSTVDAGGTGSTHAFNNVLITKSTGVKVTLSSDIKANGQLQINTGEFEVPANRKAYPTSVFNGTNGVIRVKGIGELKVQP